MLLNRTILASAVFLAFFTTAVVTQAQAQLGPRETLSGKITMFDSSEGRLYVQHANRTSFSFIVERSTRVTFDGRQLKPADLADHVNESVTVRFVPMRRGNVAQSIEISR